MRAKEQVRRCAKVAKVLIVDDHPIVREGLAQLIEQEEDLTVCGEAEGARDAIEAAEAARPDIAIVDIFLKEASGIELVKDLSGALPGPGYSGAFDTR